MLHSPGGRRFAAEPCGGPPPDVAVAGVAGAAWIRLGPLPAGLLDEADAVRSTTVLDRNGEVLYEARSDLGTREMRLRADRLPPALVGATLAAEDHRFHSHWGIDPIAMARATWRNVVALDRVEGGSTLTQQVAKLLLDRRAQLAAGTPRRRGWGSKIEEAVVALRLEHRLSKADILALYLNLAPYGNQIAGAERASHAYFGNDSSMLTPAQAAFLAALPQRPSRFNPWRSLAQATARQRVVLARMERRGFLPASAAAVARAERLRLADEDARFLAPHFVGMVLADLPDPKPTRVVTTLDAALQRTIEGIVRSQRPLLEKHGATNVAIVVLDNTTSQWLAWEGSGNYGGDRGGAINGPTSLRQPGSALKPFTYALAFESGETPATVLPDVPASFPTAEDGVIYTPRNYDGRFRGPLLARAALAGSINVPAVSLASRPRRGQRAALPAARRLHDVRQDRRALRPRAHARQRRSAPRRAHRRLRRVRARRRVARAASPARSGAAARPIRCSSCRRAPPTGSRTSWPTTRRARSSSAAAASSIFRFRSR